MAQTVSQEAGIPNGFVFQGPTTRGGVQRSGVHPDHGGDVLSDVTSGEVHHRQPQAVAGLETYRTMVADGVAPQAVVNYTETESVPIFGNGRSVFLREWPGTYGDIQGGAYKLKGEQVGVAPIPGPETRASAPSADGTWRSTPKPTCRMRPGHLPSS